MTVILAVERARQSLANAGIESALVEAQMLVGHVLGQARSYVIAHPDGAVAWEDVEPLLGRRTGHEPLAYILGWREFYGRRFYVDESVLVPRHETEAVLELALDKTSGSRALDLCTGSGCLAVNMALERPGVRVFASDVSAPALETAKRNALSLGAEVEFRAGDLFACWRGETFDLIVCNPPYVAHGDELPEEVRSYEPHAALFADENGKAFFRRLAEETGEHLSAHGRLVVEIGDGQEKDVVQLFMEGGWRLDESRADLSGTVRALAFGRVP